MAHAKQGDHAPVVLAFQLPADCFYRDMGNVRPEPYLGVGQRSTVTRRVSSIHHAQQDCARLSLSPSRAPGTRIVSLLRRQPDFGRRGRVRD